MKDELILDFDSHFSEAEKDAFHRQIDLKDFKAIIDEDFHNAASFFYKYPQHLRASHITMMMNKYFKDYKEATYKNDYESGIMLGESEIKQICLIISKLFESKFKFSDISKIDEIHKAHEEEYRALRNRARFLVNETYKYLWGLGFHDFEIPDIDTCEEFLD